MSDSPFVTWEEVASTPGPTFGLTKRQIRWDIKRGYLPGTVDHRNEPVIRRTEWNQWIAGADERKPVGVVSIREKAS